MADRVCMNTHQSSCLHEHTSIGPDRYPPVARGSLLREHVPRSGVSYRRERPRRSRPILLIQIVDNDEEAIAEANRSNEGLDAYVFCGGTARAERIANRLQAGTVDINEAVGDYVIAALPFGGIKQFGINRYHGKVGLHLFSKIKSMVIGDGKADTEAYWFPHTEAALQAVGTAIAGQPS